MFLKMEQTNLREDTVNLLVNYISSHGESSSRRMMLDLKLEGTEVNSVLYGNPTKFQSVGENPVLWSLKEPSTSQNPQSAISDEVDLNLILTTAGTSLDNELVAEIEALVHEFPGLTTDEIGALLGASKPEVENGIRRVRYLVLVDEQLDEGISETEAAMLSSLAEAGTLAFPLSTDDYDDLVRRGFVKGWSAIRMMQVFGSWRRACELAGIEAPPPVRDHYDRRWTERELAEVVARFLREPEYRGAHHRYDEWRDKNLKVDEIPSSGTLKNYLGRSWRTVQNRGLEILREKWLLESELE